MFSSILHVLEFFSIVDSEGIQLIYSLGLEIGDAISQGDNLTGILLLIKRYTSYTSCDFVQLLNKALKINVTMAWRRGSSLIY